MPSFDIVSTFEMQEIDNAVNIVKRDILNRYDFRGSNTKITLDKKNATIKIAKERPKMVISVFYPQSFPNPFLKKDPS